jgi:hypothetical protein
MGDEWEEFEEADGYLAGVHAGTFNFRTYLADVVDSLPEAWDYDDRRLLTPASRRVVTKDDPMMFALVYCRNLITDDFGNMSFADLHLELCRYAQVWKNSILARESRTAFVAPREAGKSSWVFKILPLWAAAHGHIKFVAAFSSSATQAQKHLSGFKRQLDTNAKLREDFPHLVTPAKKETGGSVANTQEMYHSQSEFTFSAAGLDSEILGLVDPMNRRPDLIILDDIEPDESNYSQYQMKKRRTTIIDTVLAMNERAHVALIGTVTMPGSIVHQLIESVTTTKEVERWIKDERFSVKYLPPIIQNEDGTERSIWPHKWPLEYLQSIRHTRSYKKNFENQPVREDGDYWTSEDFRYKEPAEKDITHVLLQIDPATTSKTTSDFYGFAVIAFNASTRHCTVLHCRQIKVSPQHARTEALRLCETFPRIGRIRVESNQGGETWHSVFHDMPVGVVIHHESINKKLRAANLLNQYQRFRVSHVGPMPELEAQMCAFPNVLNDDMVDAVGAGVEFFLNPKARVKTGGTSQTYVRRT